MLYIFLSLEIFISLEHVENVPFAKSPRAFIYFLELYFSFENI